MVYEITKQNYATEVVNSNLPVLLDYWASWCAPCKMTAPIIDAIAEEYAGKIKVGKICIETEGELASDAAIVSIPTLIVVKNGKPVEKMVGLQSPDEIAEVLEKYI